MYGEILKNLRVEKGLTQRQLADILGFKSASAIGMVERQERELSIETIIRITEYFNVSSDFLIGIIPFRNNAFVKYTSSILTTNSRMLNNEEGSVKEFQNTENNLLKNSADLDKIIKELEVLHDFEDAEHALKFILSQPVLEAYGGYDSHSLSDEEIIEISNYMLFAMRLSIEKIRQKNK